MIRYLDRQCGPNYGVPKKLVNLIKSFHEDMQAEISVGDDIASLMG